MSDSTATTQENTGKYSILAFLILALLPLYWSVHKGHMPLMNFTEQTVKIDPGPSGWYLTAKVPEAPFDGPGAEAYKTTLSAWLATLQREGFHPMLLSNVYEHLSHGLGLPDKTIVLVFEPGYGNTYRVAGPILEWYKMPAVWVTNMAAVKRSNRKYVSNFRLWRMKRSRLWDVGYYAQPGVLLLDSHDFGKLYFGTPTSPVWLLGGPVSYALNQTKTFNQLNRLKISPTWTDRELAGRLLSEVPVLGTSQLTARQVGDHVWGTSVPGTSFTNSYISLKAPLDKRAISVFWPGTRGLNDFDLQLDVSSLVGELWILARSDRDQEDAVRVGFIHGLVVVETSHHGIVDRLASSAGPSRMSKGFSAALSLHGRDLQVSINGEPVIGLHSIPESSSAGALLELMAYNKIRGTASVDGIRMIFNAQTPPPAPPQPPS